MPHQFTALEVGGDVDGGGRCVRESWRDLRERDGAAEFLRQWGRVLLRIITEVVEYVQG